MSLQHLRSIALCVSLCLVAANARPACADSPQATICDAVTTAAFAMSVDDRERTFLVHVPAHDAHRRLPVVLAFHGRGETPEQLEAYSGLSRLRAVVVYPRGVAGSGGKPSWSGTPTAAIGVDDVRFARAIVDRLARTTCADTTRVYATGKSDGGGLAARLACDAADRFAGVASVAGAYYPVAGGCRPSRAIPIVELHGSADRVVPDGGSTRRGLPAIAAWLAAWADRDGCGVASERTHLPGGVTRTVWSGCRDDATVVGYRIRGGGHTWPGASTPSGPGATTHAIDATDVIARVFGIAR